MLLYHSLAKKAGRKNNLTANTRCGITMTKFFAGFLAPSFFLIDRGDLVAALLRYESI